jgi:3-oxoacyl-[acyl-carrier protein] reductase
MLTTWARQMGWPADLDTIERRVTSEFAPVPVGRLGRVDEIGAMVLLASPFGAFINGANIRADGGFVPTVN